MVGSPSDCEIGCGSSDKVQVAFAWACCDGEPMGFLRGQPAASQETTGSITGEKRVTPIVAADNDLARSIACPPPLKTTAAATSLAIPGASLATMVLNRERPLKSIEQWSGRSLRSHDQVRVVGFVELPVTATSSSAMIARTGRVELVVEYTLGTR